MGKLIERALSKQNLAQAWEQVAANKGAPGPDAISIKRWRRNWEENLVRLRQAVLSNTYKPRRPRYVSIPKKSGGYRRLAILTVNDRVLQRAVLNVLDDVFEPMFLPCSFGYRPGRSATGAVAGLLEARDRGLRWVLDADIDECFDSLDHALMVGFIKERLGEGEALLMRLLEGWLRAGAARRHPHAAAAEKSPTGKSRPSPGIPMPGRGICQGSVISPLLCNVYLHRLDEVLTLAPRWVHLRYADDFVVLCPDEASARQALQQAQEALAAIKLQLEPSKTSITNFEDGFSFLGVHFEGDEYSYTWKDKRVEVRGKFTGFLYDFGPEDYDAWKR